MKLSYNLQMLYLTILGKPRFKEDHVIQIGNVINVYSGLKWNRYRFTITDTTIEFRDLLAEKFGVTPDVLGKIDTNKTTIP